MKLAHYLLLLLILTISLKLTAFDYWEADREELLVLSEDGDVEAIYVLGIYAEEEEDFVAAEKWFLQAAELDFGPAHFELAMMHLKKQLENSDIGSALKHFERAGELGYGEAYYNLAKLFHEGKLVEKDIQKAVKYYKLADDEISTIRLGELYADKLVEGQTPEDTFYWIQQLSYSIPESNCLIIAGYYATGYGTEKNMQEALDWYGRAAMFQRVPEALELAILCHEGSEVTQDPELAYYWALMAEQTNERENPKLKQLMATLEASLDEDTRGSIRENVQEMQSRWY
jgi:TPR repeat protein